MFGCWDKDMLPNSNERDTPCLAMANLVCWWHQFYHHTFAVPRLAGLHISVLPRLCCTTPLVPPHLAVLPHHLAGRRGGWKCGFYGGALIAVRSGPGSTPRMFFLHKYLHHPPENNHVFYINWDDMKKKLSLWIASKVSNWFYCQKLILSMQLKATHEHSNQHVLCNSFIQPTNATIII